VSVRIEFNPIRGDIIIVIILIMGVEGSGKTTIGLLLARDLNFEFADADNFHSGANIEKMRRGIPLSDSDREPWLAALHNAIEEWLHEKRDVVLACSALKAKYRAGLVLGPDVKLVYLKVSYDVVLNRLKLRRGHYAGENLLQSHFADLEEPTQALAVDASLPPTEIVREIQSRLEV
jgi:gluconokinase